MKRIPIIVCGLLALCACGTISLQDMDDELQKMHSLSEENCVSVLGPPTEKVFLEHQVELTWMRRNPSKVKMPRDYVQHEVDPVTGRPVEFEPGEKNDHICTIKLLLDKDRVVRHSFAGDRKGCSHWVEVLRAYFGTDTFAFPD